MCILNSRSKMKFYGLCLFIKIESQRKLDGAILYQIGQNEICNKVRENN
jgi:hypothetical protein